jgi:hypothetical protein
MNVKYLATNIDPLKDIGDGKVFEAINAIISDRNEHITSAAKGELVAYEIQNMETPIVTINILIKSHNSLLFRNFNYFMRLGNLDDGLNDSAKYGFGIHYTKMEDFFKLRKFYLKNKG